MLCCHSGWEGEKIEIERRVFDGEERVETVLFYDIICFLSSL